MGCWQVQALDSLAKALHVEVLELRRERARALSSQGLWGHFKNLLGYLLSAYCLFKWVIAMLLRMLHAFAWNLVVPWLSPVPASAIVVA